MNTELTEKKKVILVVEDEQPLLEAISIRLRKNGLEVVTARSVEQAKNHLEDIQNIDAVWLDHYLLGGENGFDFLIHCKTDHAWCKHIPIFVVSNTASSDKVKAYLKLGISKYYVKAEKRLDDIITEMKHELAIQE